MAKLLKLRRGNTSQHGSFTGAEGEVTVDTDKETLVVHDGSTQGGFPLLRASGGSETISTTGQISSGNITVSSNAPKIDFVDGNNNPDFRIDCNSGAMTFIDTTNSANRLIIQSDGTIDVQGNLDANSGLDVTGNITCSGTVDGRDVATDGSKLDGIEAGATANQTDAEIATALQSQRPSMKGATFTDNGTSDPIVNITTDDSSPWALRIGNDSHSGSTDAGLKIYQNADGTGEMWMLSHDSNYEDFNFRLHSTAGTKKMIEFAKANQNVYLFSAGNAKLNTLSTGVAVTGNISVTGTVDGRDVAADGSKLDGIAAGANNITNTNQLTNGAGFITSADGGNADTVDGIHGTNFLRSDSGSGGDQADADITFNGGAGAVTIAANSDIRFNSGSWTGETCKIQQNSNILYIQGGSSTNYNIALRSNGGNDRIYMAGDGTFYPQANGTTDLGKSGNRWQNIYTSDLDLSNEAKGANDIDGTWGHYTIVEGESDLFLKNNRSGKKYKFNLTEVS